MRRVAALFAGARERQAGLLLAASGALAIFIGYRAVPTIPAGHLIIAWGYYYILSVFCLFLFFAWRVASQRRGLLLGWLRRPGSGGAAIAAGTALAVWSDHFAHKVLLDEYVIQATALEMHLTKLVSAIARAYKISGSWVMIDPFLDKRPYFFPFLVSLLHDVSGYRLENAFAVNVACAAVLLGLLYWFVRSMAGRGAAILAVALFASFPLFGQCATNASVDLLNLAMVSLVACVSVLYLRDPSEDRLSLLVLSDILLTQSRYESVLYTVPVVAVVVAGWLRAGRAVIPWVAILGPLLLVPYAWHSRVLAATPIFFQLQQGQTSAFGFENVAGNARGDLGFLFNLGPHLPNSAVLSVLGLLGIAWLAWKAWGWARAGGLALSPEALAGAVFGLGILLHLAILLFYWWAKFDDLMASRFALPVCLAFAVLAALAAADLGRRGLPAMPVACAALAVWFLAFGLPAMSERLYTIENLTAQELDWEKSVIEPLPGPVLVISNKSTMPFILWRMEAILRDNAAEKANDIRYHMGQETFSEVVVTQTLREASGDGRVGIDPADVLPPSFHLVTIAEKRFGARMDRISRVVSIDPAPEKEPHREEEPTPLRSISLLHSLRDPAVAALTWPASSR